MKQHLAGRLAGHSLILRQPKSSWNTMDFFRISVTQIMETCTLISTLDSPLSSRPIKRKCPDQVQWTPCKKLIRRVTDWYGKLPLIQSPFSQSTFISPLIKRYFRTIHLSTVVKLPQLALLNQYFSQASGFSTSSHSRLVI